MKSSPCGPDTLPSFVVVKRACNVALHGNHSGLLNKHGASARTDTLATIEQQRPGKEIQLLQQLKQHSLSGNNQPVAVRIPILPQQNFGEGEFVLGLTSATSAGARLALFNMQPGAIFDAREKRKDCEDISKKSSVHISHSR